MWHTIRRHWMQLLLISAGLGLLWLTLRTASLASVAGILGRLSVGSLLLLVVVNLLAIAVFTLRWWILLLGQGYRIPFHQLVSYRLASFGVSYFTPGPHFGGEPLQVYLVVQRHGVPTAAAIGAVTMDKILEMLANFTFLGIGLSIVLQNRVLSNQVGAQAVVYALLLLSIPTVLLFALWTGRHPLSALLNLTPVRWSGPTLRRWQATLVGSEEEIAHLCRTRPSIVVAALAVSLASWIAIIGEYWLMTTMLGIRLTLVQAISALVAARIAILLPMPAGLGTLEASQVLAMNLLGESAAAGGAIGLLIRARDVCFGLLGLWIGGVDIWTSARMTGDESHEHDLPDEQPAATGPHA